MMGTGGTAQLHPDRGLAYARWLLSRDPADLSESEREECDFLDSDAGKAILNSLEAWEREVRADEGTRTYANYLLAVHSICLRVFGRMLPQRFVAILWYASWSVVLVALTMTVWWWVKR